MPTVLRVDLYRFFFYSDEGNPREPPHIHAVSGEKTAKFWLEPVDLVNSKRLSAPEIGAVQRLATPHRDAFLGRGMTTLILESEVLATGVSFTEDMFRVTLDDGRELSVPLAWFPRLLHGTPEQRRHWEPIGLGQGIHWPELDEDISVAGLLAGRSDRSRVRRAAA